MPEVIEVVDKDELDKQTKKLSLAVVLFHASWSKESQALRGELSTSLDEVQLFTVSTRINIHSTIDATSY
eukprot:1471826-Pyramimonas_sp.AAC.2